MFDGFNVARWSIVRQVICGGLAALCVVAYLSQLIRPPEREPMELPGVLGALVFIYLCGVFVNRGDDDVGGYLNDDRERDRQITRLQRKLGDAAYSLSDAEARGDVGAAARFRSMVYEFESQLRRLGA